MGISSNYKNKKNIDKDIYIVPIININKYLEENIINKDITFLVFICPICYDILNEPIEVAPLKKIAIIFVRNASMNI